MAISKTYWLTFTNVAMAAAVAVYFAMILVALLRAGLARGKGRAESDAR
jgi:hypothetical protein